MALLWWSTGLLKAVKIALITKDGLKRRKKKWGVLSVNIAGNMDSKAGGSKPRIPKDYEMSITQIPTTPNRFQSLQDFPVLSYIQATKNPTTSKTNPSSSKPFSSKKSNENSSYFVKPFIQHITQTRFQEVPPCNVLTTLTQGFFSFKMFLAARWFSKKFRLLWINPHRYLVCGDLTNSG